MIKAGIFGSTGYTGYELAKILWRHPGVQIQFATSKSNAGQRLTGVYPTGPALPLIHPTEAPLAEIDVLFLCLPHSTAAQVAMEALNAGARVVDLSADFRLKDPGIYSQWYGHEHPAPHLLVEAVYGLSEFVRDELPPAQLVANPGCYPTSILLALKPVLQAGAAAGTIIADSKSGVSGAGRAPKQYTHFVELANNFYPYNIGRSHRHLPEIEQGLSLWQDDPPPIIFSPHLLPVPRGILSTIYVPLQEGWSESKLRSLYHEAYEEEPFVRILSSGEQPTLAHVNHSNNCVISLTVAADMLILTSALDNLVKGAAGQAVQNMNLMFGIEETTGLI